MHFLNEFPHRDLLMKGIEYVDEFILLILLFVLFNQNYIHLKYCAGTRMLPSFILFFCLHEIHTYA